MSSVVQDLKLVRINSVKPSLKIDGSREAVVANFVAAFCTERRITTWFQQVTTDRRDMIAAIPGRATAERLPFVANVDTVPSRFGTADPFLDECGEGWASLVAAPSTRSLRSPRCWLR